MNRPEFGAEFSAFYGREHAEQVRRAFLLVGSQGVAEELVHDAFVGVLTRWAEIAEPGAYLNRSVVHACRRHSRRRAVVDVGGHRDVRLSEIAVESPEEAVAVGQLLLSLPFRQRASIVLRFYAHMTEAEIADGLGCRPGTIGPAIHRGLKKLRKEIT
jgi:RNA polymerase sigma factor (sigma-70 family)